MAEQIPGGAEGPNNWQVIGISRDQWRLIGAALALGGNVRAGLEDNLYLPERRDGALQRRPDRQGAADGRGRRPPRGDRRRGAGDARRAEASRGARRVDAMSRAAALGDVTRPRPHPAAARRLLLAAARRLRRRRGQGRGHRDGRLRPLGAALLRRRRAAGARHPLGAVPGAEPRQALDPPRPEVRGRPRGPAAPGRATTTSCSRASGPGVLDRLGVGYERCARRTRRLVYCAITGYGQTGPNTAARRARHELPRPDRAARPDRRARTGRPIQSAGQIADLGGGALMAAFGVMAALHERERSGEGQLVDVSMTDGALSWLAMVAAPYLCDGEVPRRGEGSAHRRLRLLPAPTRPPTAGSRCGALEPKFWRAFCEGVGRPDLIDEAVRARRAPRPGARSPRSSARGPATSGAPSTTSTTR